MMRNLKRFGALFLALVLALSLAVPAFAAVDDAGFSDVDADAWYAEAVMYCQEHNLMAGIGNNQFAPESNLTRAQLATLLPIRLTAHGTATPYCGCLSRASSPAMAVVCSALTTR